MIEVESDARLGAFVLKEAGAVRTEAQRFPDGTNWAPSFPCVCSNSSSCRRGNRNADWCHIDSFLACTDAELHQGRVFSELACAANSSATPTADRRARQAATPTCTSCLGDKCFFKEQATISGALSGACSHCKAMKSECTALCPGASSSAACLRAIDAGGGGNQPTAPERVFPLRLQICDVEDGVGGSLTVVDAGLTTCEAAGRSVQFTFKNPATDFASPPAQAQVYGSGELQVDRVWNLGAVVVREWAVPCNNQKEVLGLAGLAGNGSGITYYRYDRRVGWVENTIKSPADAPSRPTARADTCPSVPRTFLNEDSCVHTEAASCGRPAFSSVNVTLNSTTLLSWYALSRKHIHAVRGLKLEEGSATTFPPCTGGATTRWVRAAWSGGCGSVGVTSTLDADTAAIVAAAIIGAGSSYGAGTWVTKELSGADDNSATNLESCTGACDNNEQCAPGLLCKRRGRIGELVPGCTGDGGGGFWNYCYDPSWPEPAGCKCIEPLSCAYQRNNGVQRCKVSSATTCTDGVWTSESADWAYWSENACSGRLRDNLAANAVIRDVVVGDFAAVLPDGGACSMDLTTIGAHADVVRGDGRTECWVHSHPDEGNVYDFSSWTYWHPGNVDAFRENRQNPITRFSEEGQFEFVFPGWHPMERWDEASDPASGMLSLLGRFGDVVDFAALPQVVQTTEMADYFSAKRQPAAGGEAFESCGSRGEIGNDPSLGNRFYFMETDRSDQGIDNPAEQRVPLKAGKWKTWTTVVVNAPDQLRQRTAWALSQIFVIGAPSFNHEDRTELWAAYYDIFVANAFGNYRDIMREVSASPLMGEYLTYEGNSAFGRTGKFPDENYAREIMQLFSIGLWEMNNDGSYKRRAGSGELIPTYSSEDIREFARAWTGWYRQPPRSNVETVREWRDRNSIDPMKLRANRRDKFPKTMLAVGGVTGPLEHLGDRYPLCGELPAQHYLKKGAKYRYHGVASLLGAVHDNEDGSRPNIRAHFAPDPASSALFAVLCKRDDAAGSQNCTFPPVVTLEADLACNGPVECSADMLRAVKIVDGEAWGYYTYVEPPCVRLQFFSSGSVGKNSWSKVCADRNVASVIGAQCCRGFQSQGDGGAAPQPLCPDSFPNYEDNSGGTSGDVCENRFGRWICPRGCSQTHDGESPYCILDGAGNTTCHLKAGDIVSAGGDECLFVAEPMTFASASTRCAAEYKNGVVCPARHAINVNSGADGSTPDWQATCAGFQHAWTTEPCSLQVQVYSSGEVGVVDRKTNMDELTVDSGSKFKVGWADPTGLAAGSTRPFPSLADGCTVGCEALAGESGSCLCDIIVQDDPMIVDATASAGMPTEAELRARLMIGAAAPEHFGEGDAGYTRCTTSFCTSQPGIMVYARGGNSTPAALDTDTIFVFAEAEPTLRPSARKPAKYLLNRISTVHVGSTKEYTVLNPYRAMISNCTASSEHPGNFACNRAVDTSDTSEWRSNNVAGAAGGWIQVEFEQGAVRIDRMTLRLAGSEARRPKRVSLEFSDESIQTAELENSGDFATVRLDVAALTSWVRVTTIEVHGNDCVFPFTWGGNTYTECVIREDTSRWCATEVNEQGAWTGGMGRRDCETAIRDMRFLPAGHADTTAASPCRAMGMVPADEIECEAAVGKVALPAGASFAPETDRVNSVWRRGSAPPGCSLKETRNWKPIWNALRETADWDPEYWPVCVRSDPAASTQTGFKFRNPPHFVPNTGEATIVPGGFGNLRNPYGDGDHLLAPAEHETEALLDHIFEHDNTPPFVAHKMIQRFISSNPSPRYIAVVADAFTTGTYGDRTYSGKYGCMAAMIASIVLDREARASILDDDPAHGMIREPIMKVLHFLRAMQFAPKPGSGELDLRDMPAKIGQMAFESPSVFSFYLPEFAPALLAQAGLVAPEAQISIAPNLIGYMNGMASLINNGLTQCSRGFGGSGDCTSQRATTSSAQGRLGFVPAEPSNPSKVVDELALLLTGGRLSQTTRDVLVDTYTQYVAETRFDMASALARHKAANLAINESACLGVIERNLNVPEPLPVASCNASSWRGTGTRYLCDKATDDRRDTQWMTSEGPGAWIQFDFAHPVTISQVTFENGWCWNRDADRVKALLLEFSDGSSVERVTQEDNCKRGAFQLASMVTTSFVRVTVESVYKTACVFPFVHDGVLYDECTSAGRSAPWCATKVDSAGGVKQWGSCDAEQVYTTGYIAATEIQFFSRPVDVIGGPELAAGSWGWAPPGCSLETPANNPLYNRDAVGCGAYGCGRFAPVVSKTDGDLLSISASSILWQGSPWRGIDGAMGDECATAGAVSGTTDGPWWQLDLGSTQEVTSIVFHSAVDWGGGHNAGLDLYLDGVLCAASVAPIGTGDVLRIPCVGSGRLLKLMHQPGSQQSLRFCEVEVNVAQQPAADGSYASNPAAESEALKHTLKLLALFAPDFQVTNSDAATAVPRLPPTPQASTGQPYKAVVVVFLFGGADSYNMLIPHSNCTARPTAAQRAAGARSNDKVSHDLYAEYAAIRGGAPGADGDASGPVPLAQSAVLPIDVDPTVQPCSKFGLHPGLSFLQTQYQEGDAAVLTNVGALVEPVLREDVWGRNKHGAKKLPVGIAGHNTMQADAFTVHSGLGSRDAKGVLGRMVKALAEPGPGSSATPLKSAMYSLDGYSRMLDGAMTPTVIGAGEGVVRFSEYGALGGALAAGAGALSQNESRSLFAETHMAAMQSALYSTETLGRFLENTTLASGRAFPSTGLGEQLEEVAKVMHLGSSPNSTADLQTERAAFFTGIGGFDTHNTVDILSRMQHIDDALRAFVGEMKDQGLWNDTVVVVASEFGRTLSSNSQGADHGWGGNYFVLGGGVRGAQMLGTYPERLSYYDSELNLGRGIYVPTTPWESVWNAVAGWWGIDDDARLAEILPNKANFPASSMFTQAQLFDA